MECVKFLGSRKQSDVPHLLAGRDVLVLPSLYDGWGCTVNEALQQGLYVICSDQCGSKDLLSDSHNGVIFRSGDAHDLANKLKWVNDNIEEIRSYRQWRKDWADRCISGKAIAKYMIDCLCGIERRVPWKDD